MLPDRSSLLSEPKDLSTVLFQQSAEFKPIVEGPQVELALGTLLHVPLEVLKEMLDNLVG